jgi:hypothetical protein
MAKKTVKTAKHKCENHQGHLCVLVSENKIEEIKKLVRNPKQICFNCGRVADSAMNLCNPMPLGK